MFSLEAQDHLGTMSAALARLTAEPRDPDALAELRRSSHTLKGAVGTFGARASFDAALRLETKGREGDTAGVEGACRELEAAVLRHQLLVYPVMDLRAESDGRFDGLVRKEPWRMERLEPVANAENGFDVLVGVAAQLLAQPSYVDV